MVAKTVKFDYAECLDFKELNNFKKIVLKGGEVEADTFDNLMGKNPKLLFLYEDIEIIGVGALKIPNKNYKNRVFNKSQSTEDESQFSKELGWVVSLKEKEGNGSKIISSLIVGEQNLYATVRKENDQMKRLLEKFGFQKSGNDFDSKRDEYKIELYIKKTSDICQSSESVGDGV